MLLSLAIQEFLLDKRIAGCSHNTLRNYTLDLQRLRDGLDADPHLSDITADQVRAVLNALMTAQVAPSGVAKRPSKRLSAKTIQNIHTCWSSLWTWALREGHVVDHIIRAIDAPKPEPPEIVPFTKEQIKSLLNTTTHSRTWSTNPDTTSELPRQRQLRDRALLLFLLDTGVRVSELTALTLTQVDFVAGTARVASKGRLNAGQGKQRTVYFSPRTGKVLRTYLNEREENWRERPDLRLFTDRNGYELERRALSKHLRRLGRRAGITDVHPHRFRHTFAITYLRNQGDIFTLQRLLGHTSLEMCRRYLAIAHHSDVHLRECSRTPTSRNTGTVDSDKSGSWCLLGASPHASA